MGPGPPVSTAAYWIGAVTALEVPTALLMVAERDLITSTRVVPVGAAPENVNGTVTVNWPPNPRDAVLSNQAVAAWVRSTGCEAAASVKPAAAVNCTFKVVNDRVVE